MKINQNYEVKIIIFGRNFCCVFVFCCFEAIPQSVARILKKYFLFGESSIMGGKSGYSVKSIVTLPTVLFALKILWRGLWFVMWDSYTTLYLVATNATFQNTVLYIARAIIRGSIAVTKYLIGVTSSQNNPMVQLVEKEIKQVPESKIMSDDETSKHHSTRSVLKQSTDEVKIVSMSFVTVFLTWVIKTATSTRRNMIGSIAEHKKNKEREEEQKNKTK